MEAVLGMGQVALHGCLALHYDTMMAILQVKKWGP